MDALDERDRRGPCPGRAAQLRVCEDQREFTYSVARELRGVEVLDDEHAVADVEELWDLERPVRELGGHGAVTPCVAARECDTPVHQPGRELQAGAWLPGEVPDRVVPLRPPPGVEQHRVSGLRIDVGYADNLAGAERRDGDE